jgi:hypothetical protein
MFWCFVPVTKQTDFFKNKLTTRKEQNKTAIEKCIVENQGMKILICCRYLLYLLLGLKVLRKCENHAKMG